MKKYKIIILVLLDILLINFSVIVSLFLRFSLDDTYLKIPAADMERYANTSTAITMIFILFFYFFKLYSNLWRYASISELLSIVGAVYISTIASYFYSLLVSMQMPRSIYVISWMLIILFVGGVRFSYRIFWMAYFRLKNGKSAF